MARPRRGKRRRQARDWLTDYLVTGIEPERDPEINIFEVIDIRHDFEACRVAWEELGPTIMTRWNKPGCRPYAWWIYDAPRLPLGTFSGCFYDGKLPEPRRHLSGPGQPLHKAWAAYAPMQFFGLWGWYGDPANPPRFETQFDYLKRHGLLAPGEDEPLPEPHPHPAHIEDAARWEALKLKLEKEKSHE